MPNQLTQHATPFGFKNRMGAELGIFAQDKWTLDRLTLNLGVRFDYFDLYFPEQHLGPGLLVPTRDITFPRLDYVSWKDLSPRLGAVYDLFGTGRTAVKGSLGHYVIAQRMTNDYTTFGNPVNALANLVPRAWNDLDRDFIPDCDLLNPLLNGECQALTDANFGKPIPSTTSNPAMLKGWGKRPDNWEFEVGVQHQLLPRVGVDFGYFRRWYGHHTVIDNLAVAASDYTSFNITAPADSRLPDGGGYPITGLYNLNPNRVGQVNNYFTLADEYGRQTEQWNGFDATVNIRPRNGILLQGGLSTGRSSSDTCEVRAKLPELSPTNPYCSQTSAFRTQVKFLGTYTVPRVDVQIAATYQSLPGPEIAANFNAPNALIQPSLGRPLSGGAANVSVNLVHPGTLYRPQSNMMDLRFSKIFRTGRVRSALNVDLYNAFNASPILAHNNTYTATTWLTPQRILLARFAKLSVQLDF